MNLALIVGIDHYKQAPLNGCVNDAVALEQALSRNRDGSSNFSTRIATSATTLIDRPFLKANLQQLFTVPADVALFYFSGHGLLDNLGGYLVTQDAVRFDEGVSMADVLALANQSNAREVVVILDCCHSGAFGSIHPISKDVSTLREGVSVLCASRSSELSVEYAGRGMFSALVCEALYGGAANLLGEVNAAAIFAFVHGTIGPWGQRPLFKCNVSKLATLRKCEPPIAVTDLRRLQELFPDPDSVLMIEPSFEPGARFDTLEHEDLFRLIRSYRAVGLVTPIDAPDLITAALSSRGCRLTKSGQFYWGLVSQHYI